MLHLKVISEKTISITIRELRLVTSMKYVLLRHVKRVSDHEQALVASNLALLCYNLQM